MCERVPVFPADLMSRKSGHKYPLSGQQPAWPDADEKTAPRMRRSRYIPGPLGGRWVPKLSPPNLVRWERGTH